MLFGRSCRLIGREDVSLCRLAGLVVWSVLSFGWSCPLVGLVLWSALSFGRSCRLEDVAFRRVRPAGWRLATGRLREPIGRALRRWVKRSGPTKRSTPINHVPNSHSANQPSSCQLTVPMNMPTVESDRWGVSSASERLTAALGCEVGAVVP